ncbi:hypothetical protein SU69_04255 [Thermosipho melanesiensis]|uniref:Uncharacterized protein n=2 Tax=Thermosipho melanesiensis TaxID=46541 RepID=A6LL93_THEM4|nr:hypothetical protein [Thermosipho melanesiensis]ABR30694.1 hypothetical protein Tmel_0833 [Thermosipho melanesiensis BI429]APT74858.1 hypothetical protein BW47_04485 [Thermosipho melanesiensis]OOC35764.1 hypothetical protein SU68_04310 [Thermosipho melanesiensis]OOC39063.1 hypothetical protein SU69_04255 [Thermosipho melanesiensis]OOC39211.1 hypothetical protein SU70_04255 [Thermosipho melanesiensis]
MKNTGYILYGNEDFKLDPGNGGYSIASIYVNVFVTEWIDHEFGNVKSKIYNFLDKVIVTSITKAYEYARNFMIKQINRLKRLYPNSEINGSYNIDIK